MARKPQSKARSSSPNPSESASEDLTTSTPPSSIDPYAVLSVSKTATADQIRTAYRRAALKNHPDKVSPSDRDTAHQKFQEIAFAYAILSDERRRKRYDDTGSTAETLADDEDFDWVDFFRSQRTEIIDRNVIEKVKREYQGSEEEREDLLRVYMEGEGDMDAVYEGVMCSSVLEDDERFRGVIDEAITKGEVEAFPAYVGETKLAKTERVKRAKREEGEAMELAEELGVREKLFGNGKGGKGKNSGAGGGGDDDALKALIQARQKDRASADGFLDRLEEKYGGAKKGKGKRTVEEPSEEMFAKNAKKAKAKK